MGGKVARLSEIQNHGKKSTQVWVVHKFTIARFIITIYNPCKSLHRITSYNIACGGQQNMTATPTHCALWWQSQELRLCSDRRLLLVLPAAPLAAFHLPLVGDTGAVRFPD